jgi:TolA-binding protein
MTEEFDELRTSIVAAVQEELTRYSEHVSTEVMRLSDEIAAERVARSQTDDQLRALIPALDKSREATADFQTDIQRALEERLAEFSTLNKRRHEEMDNRIGRVVDEANIGLAAVVESAARPIIQQVEHRQKRVETDVGTLDKSLRKFDDQASRMVHHFNEMTQATEARMDQVSGEVMGEIDSRLSLLATRLDDVSAQAARQQSEVSNIVGTRVDQVEDRVNDRIQSAEVRINEDVGQRVADIDAYVGRVSVGLDEAVTMLNDRISATDAKFEDVARELTRITERIDSVDVDAIDEMKDRVSSTAGEVELVRIEVERFQKSVGESMDKATVRMTDLETQMQEQHMDVEAAVQLDRLEEVERAVIALDPSQFVRHSDFESNGKSDDSEKNGSDELDSSSVSSPVSAQN